MRTLNPVLFAILVPLLLVACGSREPPPQAAATTASPPPAVAPATDPYAAAVGDATRVAEARARDPFRRPAELLAFVGVKPGDIIVEIAPGAGYDTALLSRVAGPTGKVYAVDADTLFEYMPSLRESFPAYMAEDPRQITA